MAIGPKQIVILKSLAPSLALYGLTAGTFAVFATSEWVGKNILQYVPLYNRKYENPTQD